MIHSLTCNVFVFCYFPVCNLKYSSYKRLPYCTNGVFSLTMASGSFLPLCCCRWLWCWWTLKEHLIISPLWRTVPPSLPSAPWRAQSRWLVSSDCDRINILSIFVESILGPFLFFRSTICHRTFRKMTCNSYRSVYISKSSRDSISRCFLSNENGYFHPYMIYSKTHEQI